MDEKLFDVQLGLKTSVIVLLSFAPRGPTTQFLFFRNVLQQIGCFYTCSWLPNHSFIINRDFNIVNLHLTVIFCSTFSPWEGSWVSQIPPLQNSSSWNKLQSP